MLTVVRRLLAWGVVLSLLLPVVLVLVIGLGGLLWGMGDALGGQLCLRVALLVGLGWAAAVILTAVAGGLLVLETGSGAESLPPQSPQERS